MRRAPARLTAVDGLRALAATGVFLAHGVFPALLNPVGRQFINLDLGVEMFFVISGYLVFRPFVVAHLTGGPPPGLRSYFTRRVLRIYPAYWAAFVVLTLTHSVRTLGPADFWRHFFLVHEYFDYEQSRGLAVSWTLVVEVTFYAFLPFWAAGMRAAGRVVGAWRAELLGALALVAVGYPALWRYDVDRAHLQPLLRVLPPALPALGAGMVLAVLSVGVEHGPPVARDAIRAATRAGWWWIAAAVLFWVMTKPSVVTVAFHPGLQWRRDLYQSFIAPLLVAPIVLVPDGGGVIRRVLRARVVVMVGIVSYGLYLWHRSIVDNIAAPHAQHGGGVNAVFWLGLAYVISVAIAVVSFLLLERPLINLAHRSSARDTTRRDRSVDTQDRGAGGGEPAAGAVDAREARALDLAPDRLAP